MTLFEKSVNIVAQNLVDNLWATYWVYNRKTFECAKSAAIICQRKMIKEFRLSIRLNQSFPRKQPPIGVRQHLALLKALPKAIYNLKYKK